MACNWPDIFKTDELDDTFNNLSENLVEHQQQIEAILTDRKATMKEKTASKSCQSTVESYHETSLPDFANPASSSTKKKSHDKSYENVDGYRPYQSLPDCNNEAKRRRLLEKQVEEIEQEKDKLFIESESIRLLSEIDEMELLIEKFKKDKKFNPNRKEKLQTIFFQKNPKKSNTKMSEEEKRRYDCINYFFNKMAYEDQMFYVIQANESGIILQNDLRRVVIEKDRLYECSIDEN